MDTRVCLLNWVTLKQGKFWKYLKVTADPNVMKMLKRSWKKSSKVIEFKELKIGWSVQHTDHWSWYKSRLLVNQMRACCCSYDSSEKCVFLYRLYSKTFDESHGRSHGCLWWYYQKLQQSHDTVEVWWGWYGRCCSRVPEHAINKAKQCFFWKEVSLWLFKWEVSVMPRFLHAEKIISNAKKSWSKETSGKNSFFTHFFLSYM